MSRANRPPTRGPVPLFRLKIANRWWRIHIGKVPQGRKNRRRNVGLCRYEEHAIYASKNLGKTNLFATLVHEVIHAAIPKAKEHEVLEAEAAIMKVLTHLEKED
jgi:hypothetical protein